MLGNTSALNAQSGADTARLSPRRARNPANLDGRFRTARRLKAVIIELKEQVGVTEDTPLLLRAAELQVCAEMVRARLVRGEAGIAIGEVVKLENLAARALRDLRARVAPSAAKPQQSPLQQYLANLPPEEALG
jgi:hypothetical protein